MPPRKPFEHTRINARIPTDLMERIKRVAYHERVTHTDVLVGVLQDWSDKTKDPGPIPSRKNASPFG